MPPQSHSASANPSAIRSRASGARVLHCRPLIISASPPRTTAGTSSEPTQRPSGGGMRLTSRVGEGGEVTPAGPGWRLVSPSLSAPLKTKTEFHTLPLVDPSGYGRALDGATETAVTHESATATNTSVATSTWAPCRLRGSGLA